MRILMVFLSMLVLSCEEETVGTKYRFELLNPIETTTAVLDMAHERDRIKFEPLYMGKDTTSIAYEAIGSISFQQEILELFNIQLGEAHLLCHDTDILDSLSITIDISQVISYYGWAPLPKPVHPDSSVQRSQRDYKDRLETLKAWKGYPVIIKNQSDKCQIIGQVAAIHLHVEQLEGEQWIALKAPFLGCGHMASLVLPPQNIAVTIFPWYENLQSKRLRLRIGNSHSKEFEY